MSDYHEPWTFCESLGDGCVEDGWHEVILCRLDLALAPGSLPVSMPVWASLPRCLSGMTCSRASWRWGYACRTAMEMYIQAGAAGAAGGRRAGGL